MSDHAEFVIKNDVLKRYNGPGGDVSVPEGVTKIDYRAFENCTGLTRVVLPDSVTEMDVRAFSGCTGLREVVFPKSMTKLGSSAFHGCTSLESVRLPGGLAEIGWSAFENCTALHTVYLPEGITKINSEVFRNCTALTEIRLPDSVTEIGTDAFFGCSSLTSLVIPKEVSFRSWNSYHNPFEYCSKLKDLRTAEGHATLTAQNGALYDKDQETLIGWPGAEGQVELPDTVTEIKGSAFVGATGLTGITLPGSLDRNARYESQRLSGRAFEGCVNLTEFRVAPENPILYAEGGALYRRDSEDGVKLVSWPGASGTVEVPQGVKNIGEYAFSGCTGLTGIRLPGSVTKLGNSGFSGCTGLVEVVLPDNIGCLYHSVFENCTNLKQVSLPAHLKSLWGNDVFKGCCALEELTFPQEVETIDFSGFEGCTSLHRITVPESLKEVHNVPDLRFDKNYPRFQVEPDLLRTTSKLPTAIVGLSWFSNAEGLAHALLYQSAKVWQEQIRSRVKDERGLAEKIVRSVNDLLAEAERPKKAAWTQAVNFVLEQLEGLETATVQRFVQVCREKKCPLLSDLESDAGIRKRLSEGGGDGAETVAQPPEHPVERMVWEQWKVTPAVQKLQKLVKQGVRYADSEEKCSKEALIWLIAFPNDADAAIYYMSDYRKTLLAIEQNLDPIAAGLNRTDLMALLEKQIFVPRLTKDVQLFIPAYCRYADEEQMQKLLTQKRTWHSWYDYGSTGRNAEACIQEHLYLSDTKAAMRSSNLEFYAEAHGTDAQTLRDTVLADLGLDAEGKKRYDLGGKTVEARLGDDLTLTLYDEAAGKAVKSIPKKNADPEKYEAAKKEFARLKKDIRAAVKERVNLLFQRFLDGKGQKGADWQKVYFQNPLLNQIARLLVWAQGNATFTMTAQGTVDSAGQPYEVKDQPVKVAHPMEMDRDDLARWQKHFTAHALKQPFAQVWEPVIDFTKVKEDRYQGLELPANHLRSRDKHGIRFDYDNATSELRTSFAGLDLACDFTEFQRHWMDPDARVVFGKLKVEKPGRAANHVLSLLDKWTVEGRILKDDASAVEYLDSFTLAQVTELLNLAIEHQCTNCTAALLAYKNDHFADFDPMDVFTLE